jgi:hypothetical protein
LIWREALILRFSENKILYAQILPENVCKEKAHYYSVLWGKVANVCNAGRQAAM